MSLLSGGVHVLTNLMAKVSCARLHEINTCLLYLSPACRYSIDRRTDMDRVFDVHAINGSVFLLRELDREENAWHNISVVASEISESTRGLNISLNTQLLIRYIGDLR